MTIGERIRQRRIELGLTQDELAKKMGYKSRAAISNVEKDKEDLTSTRIRKYADALEVPASYLMGWTEEDYNNNSAEYHKLNTLNDLYKNLGYEFYYVACAYNELPIEGKNELNNYIEYLLTKYGVKDKIVKKEEAENNFYDIC